MRFATSWLNFPPEKWCTLRSVLPLDLPKVQNRVQCPIFPRLGVRLELQPEIWALVVRSVELRRAGGCSGVFVGLWNQQRLLFVKPSALVGPRFGELGALVVSLVTTVFPTNFPLEVAGVGVVVVVARG